MEEKNNNLEKLDLNKLTHNENGEILIVHREDEAKIVHDKQSVKLSGTIQAPGNFIEKRVTKHKPLLAHVLFSYLGRYIRLRTNESHPQYFKEVEGKLTKNPRLDEMKLNDGKGVKMGIKELLKLVKFGRFLFASSEENQKMVSNLSSFSVKAQTFIDAHNDNRGNALDRFEIKNESNIDLSFDLLMPVFIGQPAKKFKVEIAYDLRDRAVEVWFESPELVDLLQTAAKEIIDAELKRFPKEFVFIEQ